MQHSNGRKGFFSASAVIALSFFLSSNVSGRPFDYYAEDLSTVERFSSDCREAAQILDEYRNDADLLADEVVELESPFFGRPLGVRWAVVDGIGQAEKVEPEETDPDMPPSSRVGGSKILLAYAADLFTNKVEPEETDPDMLVFPGTSEKVEPEETDPDMLVFPGSSEKVEPEETDPDMLVFPGSSEKVEPEETDPDMLLGGGSGLGTIEMVIVQATDERGKARWEGCALQIRGSTEKVEPEETDPDMLTIGSQNEEGSWLKVTIPASLADDEGRHQELLWWLMGWFEMASVRWA